MKGLLFSARMGKDLAITPDGPKGPGREAQIGAVLMAERLGFPIIPVSFGFSKKKRLRVGTPSSSLTRSQKAFSWRPSRWR